MKNLKIGEVKYNYRKIMIAGYETDNEVLESIIVKFRYNKNLHGGLIIETNDELMTIEEIRDRILNELNTDIDEYNLADRVGEHICNKIQKEMRK